MGRSRLSFYRSVSETSQRRRSSYRLAGGPFRTFQTAINTGTYPSNASLLAMNGAVASEGGFPIVVDGKLIGASGGIVTQDAVTAKAGLEAAESK